MAVRLVALWDDCGLARLSMWTALHQSLPVVSRGGGGPQDEADLNLKLCFLRTYCVSVPWAKPHRIQTVTDNIVYPHWPSCPVEGGRELIFFVHLLYVYPGIRHSISSRSPVQIMIWWRVGGDLIDFEPEKPFIAFPISEFASLEYSFLKASKIFSISSVSRT